MNVLHFIFDEAWNEDMKNWWISNIDEFKDILPEDLQKVKSEEVVDSLRQVILISKKTK